MLSLGELDEGLLLGEVEVGLPGEAGELGVLCPGELAGEGLHTKVVALQDPQQCLGREYRACWGLTGGSSTCTCRSCTACFITTRPR